MNSNKAAFSRIELFAVVAVVAILAALFLLPAMARAKRQARQDQCLSNLKQFGVATKQWAADHGNKYPWHTPESDGGTRGNGAAWVHFNILSSQVSNPRIFLCPSDTERRPAAMPYRSPDR